MIDAQADLSFAVGLDLNPVFDSSLNFTDRLTDPSIIIKTFDVDGTFGVNEWTTGLTLPEPLDAF